MAGRSNALSHAAVGDAADNPDQRIAEDIRLFIERTLTISVGLLSAIVTLASFIAIFGHFRPQPRCTCSGETAIPGYLVWAAIIYAILGTALTHLIGWPLVSSISISSATRPISVSIWCGCGKIRSRLRCSTVKPPS